MIISINEYKDNEKRALLTIPNRAVQAFRPITFYQINYPCEVYREEELVHYVDTMHENKRGRGYFSELYSSDEVKLLKETCNDVANLTSKSFGKLVSPLTAPLGAIKMFRIISAISRYLNKKLSIFEIGPGSGYLGAFLIKKGHKYYSTENTQAFYLWQNRLYNYLTQNKVNEVAFETEEIKTRNKLSDYGELQDINSERNSVTHIPWWTYTKLYKNCDLKVDIVVCDHALAELHPNALKYVLRLSKEMLKGDGTKLFLFLSTGKTHMTSFEKLFEEFKDAGFIPLFSRGFFGFAPIESELSKYALDFYELLLKRNSISFIKKKRFALKKVARNIFKKDLPSIFELRENIPFYDPSNNLAHFSATDFMKIISEENSSDYDFLSFLGESILPKTDLK